MELPQGWASAHDGVSCSSSRGLLVSDLTSNLGLHLPPEKPSFGVNPSWEREAIGRGNTTISVWGFCPPSVCCNVSIPWSFTNEYSQEGLMGKNKTLLALKLHSLLLQWQNPSSMSTFCHQLLHSLVKIPTCWLTNLIQACVRIKNNHSFYFSPRSTCPLFLQNILKRWQTLLSA